MLLKGEKVYLRALEPSDAQLIYNWENNPSIWRISNTLYPFSQHLIEQYVNSAQDIFLTKQLRFVICLTKDHTPLGTIDLFDYEPFHRRAGVGIIIAEEEFRQKGLAWEALSLLIDYSFDVLLLHQLYCNIEADNESSLSLFTSKDFKIVGLKKDWNLTSEGFKDEFLLQLINYRAY
jgi:diamine N-acetyltransferase